MLKSLSAVRSDLLLICCPFEALGVFRVRGRGTKSFSHSAWSTENGSSTKLQPKIKPQMEDLKSKETKFYTGWTWAILVPEVSTIQPEARNFGVGNIRPLNLEENILYIQNHGKARRALMWSHACLFQREFSNANRWPASAAVARFPGAERTNRLDLMEKQLGVSPIQEIPGFFGKQIQILRCSWRSPIFFGDEVGWGWEVLNKS